MQASTPCKIDNLCRTCVTSCDIPIDSIFSESKISLSSFALMITECTSVNISSTDEFPKLICIDCKSKLEISYSFKKQCHQSERKLNEIFKAAYGFTQIELNPLDIKNENIEDFQTLKPEFDDEAASLLESDTSLSTEETSKQHKETNHTPYKCNVCFKTYLSKLYFDRHIAQGHSTECDRCCRKFENFELLRKHMTSHEADLTRFSCYVCKKGYDRKQRLKHHLLSMHPKEHIIEDADKKNHTDLDFSSTNCLDDNNDKSIQDEFTNSVTTNLLEDVKNNLSDKIHPIKCNKCLKEYDNDKLLAEHVKTHENLKLFYCDVCGKRFQYKSCVKRHLKIHSSDHVTKIIDASSEAKNKIIKIELDDTSRNSLVQDNDAANSCDVDNSRTSSPIDDTINHTDSEDSVKDDRCDKELDNSKLLPQHIKTQNGDPFSCHQCGKGFETHRKLRKHTNHVHSTKFRECEECNTTYQSRDSYRKHLIESHRSKLYKCDFCEKLFLNAPMITRHMRKFHCNEVCNVKTYFKPATEPLRQGDEIICRRCLLNCGSEELFAAHIKTHEEDIKPYKCRECGKEFNKRFDFTSHFVIHSNLKPHVCEMCGKGFNHPANLSTHRFTHTGERPWKCKVCPASFAQRATLRYHEGCHNPETLKCEYCGSEFARKKSLRIHIKRHLGLRERKYPCSACEKKFHTKYQLTNHTRIHTGEKSHVCPVCDKRFDRPFSLKVHMRVHTGEKPFPCTVCKKTFAQKHVRDSHMKTHQSAQ